MMPLPALFPAHQEWPPAVDDVAKAPTDASRLRLTAGARQIDTLPTRSHLRHLWCFDIDAKKFDAICHCPSLEALYIENLKTDHLGSLQRLARLRILALENCSKVRSLDEIGELRSLTGLAIIHFKQIRELGPLARLQSLRALAVAGSLWTTMRVNSFSPLRELIALEWLHLANIKAEDEALRPLGDLRGLRQLDVANFYPMSEFAWLARRLDTTACLWFQPFAEMKHVPCKKCGELTMVLLTGKRKPALCSGCDRVALEAHVREWNELLRPETLPGSPGG